MTAVQLPLPFRGDTPEMKAIASQVDEARHSDAPVLLLGERGTGRGLLARTIHETSARRGRGFLPLDASSAPPDLSPLAHAAGGTVLVREMSKLARPAQRGLAKVLRRKHAPAPAREATQEAFDFRCIGATDVDLGAMVADGLFERELYDRFAKNRIEIPPLRRRSDDVPLLADAFARRVATELGRGKIRITTAAHERMRQYPWPGNVAELREVVRQLVLRARSGEVTLGMVEKVLPDTAQRVPLEQLSFEDMVRAKLGAFLQQMEGYPVEDLYGEVIVRVERPLLEVVLARTGGNLKRAAHVLGITPAMLKRKLAAHGMTPGPPQGTTRK